MKMRLRMKYWDGVDRQLVRMTTRMTMRRMVKVAEEKVSSRGAIVGSVIPQSNYHLI